MPGTPTVRNCRVACVLSQIRVFNRACDRRSTFCPAPCVNPAPIDLPPGVTVFRAFATASCAFLTTSRGVYGFGLRGLLGTQLFTQELLLDFHAGKTGTPYRRSRVLPAPLRFFKVRRTARFIGDDPVCVLSPNFQAGSDWLARA